MSATYLDRWNTLPNHVAYQAPWTAKNAHLQGGVCGICRSAHLTLCQKIRLVFKRIIEAIVRFFTPASFEKSIQKALIPTSRTDRSKIEQHYDAWESESTGPFTRYCLDLTTPDDQKIHALFYERAGQQRDLPTIVYFQGMTGETFKSSKLLLEFADDSSVPPCHFIVFDFRASGLNRLFYEDRSFNARDLILDGQTVVEAAIHKLGITQILFFGVSFGGAICTFVAREYEGRFVNYNSFSRLEDVFNASLVIREGYERFVMEHAERSCPWTCLSRLSAKRALCVLSAMTPHLGWDLKPKDVLPSMQKRMLCVYHPGDTVIPRECAAYTALPLSHRCATKVIASEEDSFPPDDGVALHQAQPDVLIAEEDGTPMKKKITDFLLGSPILL